MAEDGLSAFSISSHSCPKPCSKPSFSAFTMPLLLEFRVNGQAWHMESHESRPWFQNSGFTFGEHDQEKMCPLGTSHLQLVDLG
jgi:hypothetical protein